MLNNLVLWEYRVTWQCTADNLYTCAIILQLWPRYTGNEVVTLLSQITITIGNSVRTYSCRNCANYLDIARMFLTTRVCYVIFIALQCVLNVQSTATPQRNVSVPVRSKHNDNMLLNCQGMYHHHSHKHEIAITKAMFMTINMMIHSTVKWSFTIYIYIYIYIGGRCLYPLIPNNIYMPVPDESSLLESSPVEHRSFPESACCCGRCAVLLSWCQSVCDGWIMSEF